MNRLRKALIVIALAPPALPLQGFAQEAEPFEPAIHWAYASFFGTGWYKINDQRSSFIMRAPLRCTSAPRGLPA